MNHIGSMFQIYALGTSTGQWYCTSCEMTLYAVQRDEGLSDLLHSFVCPFCVERARLRACSLREQLNRVQSKRKPLFLSESVAQAKRSRRARALRRKKNRQRSRGTSSPDA